MPMMEFFINPQGHMAKRKRNAHGRFMKKGRRTNKRRGAKRARAAAPHHNPKRRHNAKGRRRRGPARTNIVRGSIRRSNSHHRGRRKNPFGIKTPTVKGIMGNAWMAAKLTGFTLVGKLAAGTVTEFAVDFINGQTGGGGSAVLESAVAAASGLVMGALASIVSDELAVGTMLGAFQVAAENVIMASNSPTIQKAIRPLGAYSKLTGYSSPRRLTGYSKPHQLSAVRVVPAGVPGRRLIPRVSTHTMQGFRMHRGGVQQQ